MTNLPFIFNQLNGLRYGYEDHVLSIQKDYIYTINMIDFMEFEHHLVQKRSNIHIWRGAYFNVCWVIVDWLRLIFLS